MVLSSERKLETDAREADVHGCMLVVVIESLKDLSLVMHSLEFTQKGRLGSHGALRVPGRASRAAAWLSRRIFVVVQIKAKSVGRECQQYAGWCISASHRNQGPTDAPIMAA